MRDYPEYNPSVGVGVSSGNSAMAQANEQRANLYGNLAQKAFGVAQANVDQKEMQEGKEDAAKQGLGWSPKSSLTEAGRAYNQEGQQVARNVASSQVLNQMNAIYNQVMNKPITIDPKTGAAQNMTDFTNAANQYYQNIENTIDPKMKPYMDQIFNSSMTSYGSRIANRVGSYMKAQTIANYINTANQLSNHAGNLMAQAYATTDPKIRAQLQRNAFDILQSANQQSSMLGDPIKSGNMQREHKENFLNASVVGRMKGLMQQYNNATDPADKQALAQQIQQFPENFANDEGMQKVYGQVSLDDNMSAISQERMTRTLNRMSAQFGHALKANTNQMQLQMKNAVISVGNGSPVPKDLMAQVQSEYPKLYPEFNDKIQTASLTNSMYQDYVSRGIGSIQGFISKYNDPHQTLSIPGVDSTVQQNVKTQLIKQFGSYVKQVKNDPYSTVSNTAPAKTYMSQQLNSLNPNKTGETLSSTQLQTELSQSVSNPMVNFESARSPQVSEALNNYNTHIQQLQSSHGISSQYQTMISADQAKTIVNNLSNMDPVQRIQALTTAEGNYGNHWGSVQRALLNAKLPYDDLISARILSNTSNNSIVSDMMNGHDILRQEGAKKAYTDLGTTYKDARQQIISAMPHDFISNLQSNPGSQSSQFVNGIINSILNLSVARLQKSNQTWATPMVGGHFTPSNVTQQSIDDVMNSLYQNGAKDGIRVPYKVITKNPSGGYTPTDINYSTVKTMMAYYKNKATTQAMVDDKSVDVRKALSNAKWVNSPSNEGLQLVQSNGKPFYYKNGKPYSFTFETAANPGSIPGDYNEYAERRGI